MIEYSNNTFTIKKPKKNIFSNVDTSMTTTHTNECYQYQLHDDSKNSLNNSKNNSKTKKNKKLLSNTTIPPLSPNEPVGPNGAADEVIIR